MGGSPQRYRAGRRVCHGEQFPYQGGHPQERRHPRPLVFAGPNMLNFILSFSIRHRWLVLIAAAGVGLLGVYNYRNLSIDAVPDITNIQVQINTEAPGRSEEHTSELQSRGHLVCRLLLEKKKKNTGKHAISKDLRSI